MRGGGAGGGAYLLRSWAGCVGQTLVFVWDGAMREGLNFYFSAVWDGVWAPYNSMKFKIFLSFPNIPGSQDFSALSR